MTALRYTVDVRSLDEFAPADLYAMLKMRFDVFIVEQNCIYPELDGKDTSLLHLRLLDGDLLLASARIGGPSAAGEPAVVGRVVVSPAQRGKRLGEALMKEAIQVCEKRFAGHAIELAAQSYLQDFYRSFGFVAVSDEYMEDNIPHIDMRRPATAGPSGPVAG